jgi:hypothetical protein
MTESEIRQLVDDYVAQAIPLDDVESRLLDIDLHEETELSRKLVGLLAEASHAHWSEQDIRQELEIAARPFAPQWENVSPGLFLVRQKEPENRNVASGKTEVVRKPPMPEVATSLGSSARLLGLEAAPA